MSMLLYLVQVPLCGVSGPSSSQSGREVAHPMSTAAVAVRR
jgi:hypothetical protein